MKQKVAMGKQALAHQLDFYCWLWPRYYKVHLQNSSASV